MPKLKVFLELYLSSTMHLRAKFYPLVYAFVSYGSNFPVLRLSGT
jgi:hypothetical protein